MTFEAGGFVRPPREEADATASELPTQRELKERHGDRLGDALYDAAYMRYESEEAGRRSKLYFAIALSDRENIGSVHEGRTRAWLAMLDYIDIQRALISRDIKKNRDKLL